MRGEQLSTSDVFEMAAEKRLLIIVGKGQMFSHTTSDEAMDVEPDARVTGERNADRKRIAVRELTSFVNLGLQPTIHARNVVLQSCVLYREIRQQMLHNVLTKHSLV